MTQRDREKENSYWQKVRERERRTGMKGERDQGREDEDRPRHVFVERSRHGET